VGGSNYSLFFSSMTFALVLLTYQLGLGLFLFISSFHADAYAGDTSAHYIRQSYGQFSSELFQAVVGIMLTISTPLVLALLQLFGLHVYLWQRGITTYEVSEIAIAMQEITNANRSETHSVALLSLARFCSGSWSVVARCKPRRRPWLPAEKTKCTVVPTA
jgi:hypothetical protein